MDYMVLNVTKDNYRVLTFNIFLFPYPVFLNLITHIHVHTHTNTYTYIQIAEAYKKKIESIVRKPTKQEEDEPVTPCPYCAFK
jgi:hypothetical protein